MGVLPHLFLYRQMKKSDKEEVLKNFQIKRIQEHQKIVDNEKTKKITIEGKTK